MLKILVVEDVPGMQARVVDYLTQKLSGYTVLTASHRAEALRKIAVEEPNLILLDLAIPPDGTTPSGRWTEGRDVLRAVKAQYPFIKVIVLTSRGELARDFLREEGADDFFTKDDSEEWTQGKLALQIAELIGYVVCRSPAMQGTRQQLEEIVESDRLVLLEGEPGTGKRYLAQVLHRCSRQAHRKMEELDCVASGGGPLLGLLLGSRGERERRGLLENEDVGTVLLHGVEALPREVQQPLAAVLEGLHRTGTFRPLGSVEEAPARSRLVLAVNGSWRALQGEGKIAPELYPLFAPEWGGIGKSIHLPPLRERTEDLPDLATHLCRQASLAAQKSGMRIHPHTLALLQQIDYPGHARQLERLITAAVQRADGDTLRATHLGIEVPGRYQVLYNRGEGIERKEISAKELPEFTDPAEFDLVVCVGSRYGQPVVESITAHGQSVEIRDARLLGLLLLLMTHAGEKVDVKRHKRDLGLAPAEPLKRFIFDLRQALGDTDVKGTRSQFFTSHWGEACSFNVEARFSLIREQPEGSP